MPTTPAAPFASIEPAWNDIIGVATSPFTGDQQFTNWGPGPCEISVVLIPMYQSVAENWVTFLLNLAGQANYFQFPSAFSTLYADILKSSGTPRNWRLKSNQRKWMVSRGNIYKIAFDCREAF